MNTSQHYAQQGLVSIVRPLLLSSYCEMADGQTICLTFLTKRAGTARNIQPKLYRQNIQTYLSIEINENFEDRSHFDRLVQNYHKSPFQGAFEFRRTINVILELVTSLIRTNKKLQRHMTFSVVNTIL